MATDVRFSSSWQDIVNCLLGIGLFFSPWLFSYAGEQTPALNAHVVGAIIAVLALAALFAFQDWEEWISVALGAWLIASPWVLGFSHVNVALLSHVLIGLATIVLAIWSSAEHGTHLPAGR
jgi:hypothetical protein